MNLPIRYSPSGTVIADVGAGFRMRLIEQLATMAGTSDIPTQAGTICTDGFDGASPVLLVFDNATPEKRYRAELRCDLFNVTSSTSAVIALSIQTSADEGASWVTRVVNAHVVQPQLGVGVEDNGQAREASVVMELNPGSAFGLTDASTALWIRAQAQTNTTLGAVVLSSQSSIGGFNSAGTIHLLGEECV